MKAGGIIVFIGVIFIALAFAAPNLAVLSLASTSANTSTAVTFSPTEGGSNTFTFNQAITQTSGSSYTVSQTYNDMRIYGSSQFTFSLQVPNGQELVGESCGVITTETNIGVVTVKVDTSSVGCLGSTFVTFNQGAYTTSNSAEYTDLQVNLQSEDTFNYYGNVTITVIVTDDSQYGWTYFPSGSVTTTASTSNVFDTPQVSTASGLLGDTWHWNTGTASISSLVATNMQSFTLDWSASQSLSSIAYNSATQSGTSGSFTNSPPSQTSVTDIDISNHNYGGSVIVTFTLSNVVLESTGTGITNAGHFYINIGTQWEQVTPTSVIKLSVSSFPTQVTFAYVEDNGTTSGASYAYITVDGAQTNITFTNSVTINSHTGYTTSITFKTAGNYTIDGFLKSSSTNGGSLQLMSFTWNGTTGATTGGSPPPTNTGNVSGLTYNVDTLIIGIGITMIGMAVVVIRK